MTWWINYEIYTKFNPMTGEHAGMEPQNNDLKTGDGPPENGDTDGEETSSDRDMRTVPPDLDAHEFPDAAAVRIAGCDLWIANGDAVEPDNLDTMGLDPEYVVSVNKRVTAATTDYHPLDDGRVNDHEAFCDAVDTARKRITQDGTVIINCAAGISRSSTVMATALAAEYTFPLQEAIHTIQQYREQANPHPKLQINAYGYLGSVEGFPGVAEYVDKLSDEHRLRYKEQQRVEEILAAIPLSDGECGDVERDVRTIPDDATPGYEFPDAIAVRIGDRDLWIADSGAIDPDNLDAMGIDPEYVVSVNTDPTAATTDFHPLDDARVNDPDEFAAAVDATRDRLNQNGVTVVNCTAGVSRSTTVLATAIAAEEDIPLNRVIDYIQQYRERAQPHKKLQINAYGYLGRVESHSGAIDHMEDIMASVRLRASDEDNVAAIRNSR